MTFSTNFRRRSAPLPWWAVWLVLLHTLMPSLVIAASASAGPGPVRTIEICSAHGVQKLVLDTDGSPTRDAGALAGCPCCLSGNCSPAGMPAGGSDALRESSRATAVATLVLASPLLPADTTRAWLSLLADGPPSAG